jgi:hypothetical protein
VITGALSGGYRVTEAKGWVRSETFTPLPNSQPAAEWTNDDRPITTKVMRNRAKNEFDYSWYLQRHWPLDRETVSSEQGR